MNRRTSLNEIGHLTSILFLHYLAILECSAVQLFSCVFQHLTGRVRSTRLRPISLFGC